MSCETSIAEQTAAAETAGLLLSNTVRRYGRRSALRGLSFRVKPGECVVLRGSNGSGKSTLLRCISGLETPDKGSVSIWGMSPHRGASFRKIKETVGVGLLTEKNHLYRSLSIRENLELSLRLSFPDSFEAKKAELSRLAKQLEIERELDISVSQCSMGIARRAGLLRQFLIAPRLMLFDEPFSNLDDRGRELLCDCFRKLDLSGRVLIVATHLEETLGGAASRRIVLERGLLLEDTQLTPGEMQ